MKLSTRERVALFYKSHPSGGLERAAEDLGIDRSTVRYHRRTLGIAAKRQSVTDSDLRKMRELREAGRSFNSIAKELGFHVTTVRRRLTETETHVPAVKRIELEVDVPAQTPTINY